jgi:hypothetical protein
MATQFPVYYPEHVAKVSDPKFMKSIREFRDKTEELYKELSAARMPAAKHELPKKRGGEALLADAPGMGLPDPYAGSISWHVRLDDKPTAISRRDLADKFFGILGWHEDIETAVQLAKQAKARRKRLRREARRHARNPPSAPERLDQFFRTDKELKYDEQPIAVARTWPQELRKKTGSHKPPIKERKKEKAANGESRPQHSSKTQQELPPDPPPYFVREPGIVHPRPRPPNYPVSGTKGQVLPKPLVDLLGKSCANFQKMMSCREMFGSTHHPRIAP